MLAAVDFGILAPGFFRVATGLLNHIRSVEPALQMSAAELAFLIPLVAGTLSRLLNLDLVMRKLRRSLRVRSGHFARRQSTYPHSGGASAAGVGLRAPLYLKISISLRAGSVLSVLAGPSEREAGMLLVSNGRVPLYLTARFGEPEGGARNSSTPCKDSMDGGEASRKGQQPPLRSHRHDNTLSGNIFGAERSNSYFVS